MVKKADKSGKGCYKLVRSKERMVEECEDMIEKPEMSDEEAEGGGVKMKSELTLLNGCTIIVGCIIGSGIFVSPTGVLQSTGSVNLSLLVWVASGLFSMIGWSILLQYLPLLLSHTLLPGAYCYAELGCMIQKSGADYAYIHFSFGPFLAFIRMWIECIILRPCIGAIQSLTFALYILKPFFPECDPPSDSVRILAAACLCLLCFINCFSVKWAAMVRLAEIERSWYHDVFQVQDYFTYAKMFALILISITGMVQLGNGKTEFFTFENSETDVTVIALSFYSGLFSYTGWNYLNFIIEEMKVRTVKPHSLQSSLFIIRTR